jgi:predicted signal transduction protein with EAL and GGDEF domain
VTLEVTESLFATDGSLRSEFLPELRDTGMKVAIDDFGTGYSSLSLLRDLPVDVLKIDKSFIDHIIDEPDSARPVRRVRTILQLAEDFNVSTVAEGVAAPVGVSLRPGFLLLQAAGVQRDGTAAPRAPLRHAPGAAWGAHWEVTLGRDPPHPSSR